MNEASKSPVVILPTGKDSPELVEPCKQPFDLPATLIAAQFSSILRSRPDAIALVRRDQFNVIDRELFIERITVVGAIPDKSSRQSQGDSCIDGSFDKGDFMWASRIRVQGDWKTCSVRNCHELCTFAPLGLSHFAPPFFATMNVPSMKHSDKSMSPLAKAPKAGGVRWKLIRQIRPGSAGAQNPQDTIHDGTVIMLDRPAPSIGTPNWWRNQRRQYSPLLIGKSFPARHLST